MENLYRSFSPSVFNVKLSCTRDLQLPEATLQTRWPQADLSWRRSLWSALFGLICLFLFPNIARAEVERYAVVIGSNQGAPSDESLLYATRDADRMADVLSRHGGVRPENLIVLKEPDAKNVERVLQELNRRIEALQGENQESVLFVFFSGHADATAMHLGDTLLPFARVRRVLTSSPAQMRVMIIDACRSGGLTRVKGGKPAKPFEINADNQLAGEGLAIITSSAAGEDALESDRLQGSFFTHFLISGLLGAADTTKDRKITLTEAYQYAYLETLRATSRVASIQHPTYSFQIKGRGEPILTRLDVDPKGFGRLKLPSKGDYIFFRKRDDGPLVAEGHMDKGAVLSLAGDQYLVRRRTPDAVYEIKVQVKPGATTVLPVDEMRRVSYGEVVRKGLRKDTSLAWAISTGAQVSGEILPGTGELLYGSLGLHFDLEALTLETRFRYGLSQNKNASVEIDQQSFGLDIAALRLFDLGNISTGFGLRIGGDWIQQSFTTPGIAPNRGAPVGRGGALISFAWSATSWMTLYLEASAMGYLYEAFDPQTNRATLTSRLVPEGSLGFLFYLP